MGRLKLEQLCHPVTKGGLGLFNTERKAKALFTRQTSRMLRRKGRGFKHITFWLGSSMANQITLHEEGPRTPQPPSGLHLQIKHRISEQLEKGDEALMLSSTAKMIYSSLSGDLPLPRLAQEVTDEEEVKRVFGRLSSKVLNVHQRHAIFCLVNRLVRNNEYMSRVWDRGDAMCDHNPDESGECAGVEQTVPHLYQTWEESLKPGTGCWRSSCQGAKSPPFRSSGTHRRSSLAAPPPRLRRGAAPAL